MGRESWIGLLTRPGVAILKKLELASFSTKNVFFANRHAGRLLTGTVILAHYGIAISSWFVNCDQAGAVTYPLPIVSPRRRDPTSTNTCCDRDSSLRASSLLELGTRGHGQS